MEKNGRHLSKGCVEALIGAWGGVSRAEIERRKQSGHQRPRGQKKRLTDVSGWLPLRDNHFSDVLDWIVPDQRLKLA